MPKAKYVAVWTDANNSHEVCVGGYNDLLELLDEIGPQPDPATLLEVFDPSSRRALGIGLGKRRTVLTYQDSLDPPYYISRGDVKEQGVETFFCGGEPTEYLAANLVGLARGFSALREFFEMDTRPTACSWEKL